MKTEIQIEIQPFEIPSYVSEGLKPSAPAPAVAPGIATKVDPKYYTPQHRVFALRELSPETLEKLCSDFTDSVFEAASKQKPDRPTYAGKF